MNRYLDENEEESGLWRNLRINYKYVQDLILEQKDEIFENIMHKNGKLCYLIYRKNNDMRRCR